jgi:hypothetical protein
MVRYVLRVWLADRPGSLGLLAGRIGDVRGDLVGIDILERDGSRAIDELTVELPDEVSAESLAAGVSTLPGVELEDIRVAVSRFPYSTLDPFEVAVAMAEGQTTTEVIRALAHGVCSVFACNWSAVVDLASGKPTEIEAAGTAPHAPWLGAFIAGASAGPPARRDGELAGPRDIAWAPLESTDMVTLVGRDGPPFRSLERRQLQQLCRVADARWRDLVLRGESRTQPGGQSLPRGRAHAS